jgi:hypothetical protein
MAVQEQSGLEPAVIGMLKKCLDAATHLVVLSRAEENGWHEMAAKAATSLLRFLEPVQQTSSNLVLMPADKAFYLAGCAWKKVCGNNTLMHHSVASLARCAQIIWSDQPC